MECTQYRFPVWYEQIGVLVKVAVGTGRVVSKAVEFGGDSGVRS